MDDASREQQIARSATIVSVGNVLSRMMGLVREAVIANMFGASGAVSAYKTAAQVPLTLYEMLVGGMVSSALVPTLSGYAAAEQRDELGRIAGLLFTFAVLVLGAVVLLLEVGAPLLTPALVHFDAPLQALTTRLLRIVLVSVFFLGLSGIATALCQALQRFALPAFTTVVFNASIVAAALTLGSRWRDVRVLAAGMVVGAALQVVLQLPALRDLRIRPALDLRDPLLRHILRLYAPVVLSLVVASLGILIDRNLASRTGESSISWMHYATTLIQFPLGLISMAIATAILPALARQAGLEDERESTDRTSERFRATLASGLRLVLFLTIPAAVGLLVLAQPVIALLFQHGEFGPVDTAQTALALRIYLIGLIFAAVDQPLVFAFYARKDTLRPALVGILGVGFYLIVALPTLRTLGMVGLILANGAQLAGHASVMIWLFQRRVGSLRGQGIGGTLLKSVLAAAMMGGAVYGATRATVHLLPVEGRALWGATVVVGAGIGLGVYLALCALLKVPELDLARGLITQVIRRLPLRREG